MQVSLYALVGGAFVTYHSQSATACQNRSLICGGKAHNAVYTIGTSL